MMIKRVFVYHINCDQCKSHELNIMSHISALQRGKVSTRVNDWATKPEVFFAIKFIQAQN